MNSELHSHVDASQPSLPAEWTEVYDAAHSHEPWSLRLSRVLGALWASRGLAWRLFQRNLTANYRQSYLGWLWVLLPPLASAGVWVFLNVSGTLSVSHMSPLGYAAFVYTGLLLWQGFMDGLMAPLQTMQANRSVLSKLQFPREVLITVGLLETTFDLLTRCLVALFFLWLAGLGQPLGVIALVVFWAPLLVILGMGFGLWLAPFGLLYKDVSRTITMISPLWMLLTPVIYPLPDGAVGQVLTWANPPAAILHVARANAIQPSGRSAASTESENPAASNSGSVPAATRLSPNIAVAEQASVGASQTPADAAQSSAASSAVDPGWVYLVAVAWGVFGVLAFLTGAIWVDLSGPIVIERLAN